MFEPSHLPDSQTPMLTTLQTSIEKIFATGKITFRDRQILQNALLHDSALTREQSDRVRAIYDRVRMGFIRIVD